MLFWPRKLPCVVWTRLCVCTPYARKNCAVRPRTVAGVWYKSIKIPSDTPTISDEDRQVLLETLCCFFNLDDCKPKRKGGPLMAAWLRAKQAQMKSQLQIFRTEEELQKLEDFGAI